MRLDACPTPVIHRGTSETVQRLFRERAGLFRGGLARLCRSPTDLATPKRRRRVASASAEGTRRTNAVVSYFCWTNFTGMLSVEPLPPGGSKLALRTTRAMHC